MNSIEVTDEELMVMDQLLQHALATLQLEISHTDHREFKEHLKVRRKILESLRSKLPRPLAEAA